MKQYLNYVGSPPARNSFFFSAVFMLSSVFKLAPQVYYLWFTISLVFVSSAMPRFRKKKQNRNEVKLNNASKNNKTMLLNSRMLIYSAGLIFLFVLMLSLCSRFY